MSLEIACPKCGRIYERCREALSGPYCECPPQRITYASDTAMTTTNTPLTDAVSKAIGRHLAEYASRRSEGQHGTLADAAFDIGVELDAVRTLETRLHAAEELLRGAQAVVRDLVYVGSGDMDPVSVAYDNNIVESAEQRAPDVCARIAAHLANAANPASATTTKETQP